MAVRTPLKLDGSDLREMTTAEINAIKDEAARLYGLTPSVTLAVVGSGGNLGTISDTRLDAGAGSTSTTAFPDSATTDDVSTITVNYSKLNTAIDTSEADWTNATYSYPLYYDGADLVEMSAADFGDTFIKPAIDDITATGSSPGTYFISTSNSVVGATLVSATPVFTDTRYDEPVIGTSLSVSYEIIGGGGGGGAADPNATTAPTAGSSSTISGSGITTVTGFGGSGGANGNRVDRSNGASSFYGAGGEAGLGAGGGPGGDAPSTSYGAGGGAGFGGVDYNGGTGGSAATRKTGTFSVASGTQITIVIGAGGVGGVGFHDGGDGAGGYAKLTIGGTVYEYTTAGTYNITPTGGTPSADLFYPEDNPITITNYYLHKQNGSATPVSIELPICYTKSGIDLQAMPTATIQDALETMIRYYAAEVTGTKISYNINGTGTNQGSTMTDTKLNSSTYYTEYEDSDTYKAQEIPSGTATTISTYNLKITQT